MAYFLIYIIAVFLGLFLFALPIQASGFYLHEAYIHNDDCIISQFGETADPTSLLAIVNETPLAKVVDAFIECPIQMAEVYYVKLGVTAFEELDDLVKFVRNYEKMNHFYVALRSFPSSETLTKCDLTRQAIYAVSFIYDIPPEHYLDEMEQYIHVYMIALLEKAKFCKTPESKSWINGLLNEAIIKLEEIPASELLVDYEHLSYFISLTTKLMNNEYVSMEGVDPHAKSGLVCMALSFNRFDVAEEASENSLPIDLETATDFLKERATKCIDDIPRAVEILKRLLPSDEERKSFDEFVRNFF